MIITINNLDYRSTNIPMMVLTLGFKHNQESINRIEGVSHFQWFFCEKGQGEVIIDEKKMIINEGQGFLIYPNTAHEYHALSDEWLLDFVGFNGDICLELLTSLDMTQSGAYHLSDTQIFSTSVLEMINTYKTSANFKIELSTYCYKLLLNLANAVRLIIGENQFGTNRTVNSIISFIEENYHQPINLDDIASSCGMTKEHICGVFKKNMNQTINHFLTNVRIIHARVELLQFPEKKIHQIADSCGFQDSSYFCKVFKKNVGYSPEQFRKVRY